jgi:ABC-type nitrate/sulfonate/bicarbonate transport system permease component
MIRSVVHTETRAWHRSHLLRHKRVWAIMTLFALTAFALFLSGAFAGVDWHELLRTLFLSTYRLAGGYFIGLAIGAGVAYLVGWSPRLSEGLFPILDILQNVPSFAVLPIFVVLMGYSDLMIILFTATGVMWPILFAILSSIRNAHADLNDAASIYGADGLQRIIFYLAPLSFPAVLTGSIVGIAIGWESVIGAELIGQVPGIGSYIGSAGTVGVTPVLAAGIIGILAVVFTVNRLVWAPLLAESSKRYAE